MNGLVLIDKPGGCTSHDIVNRWRRLAGAKKTGHLGTLDPMATGLLLLLTGTATRLAPLFHSSHKTYRAAVTLGLESDTYDIDGAVLETGRPIPQDEQQIRTALLSFHGRFLQTPPRVSAKKIKGVAAHKLVRQNVDFDLKPVEVEVQSLEAGQVMSNKLELLITCSTGTYIRSIAHDFGKLLGCGAVLSSLRRVEVGDFRVDDASTIEQLEQLAKTGRLDKAVLPQSHLLPDLPAEHFTQEVEMQIRQGRSFRSSPFVIPPGTPKIRALSQTGELIAIADMTMPNVYHPYLVLAGG
jgi:tRNA pseudouridine55 synthase